MRYWYRGTFHGAVAEDRDHRAPRSGEDVRPPQGHRDARGGRPEGRRDDHGADREEEPPGGVLRDGLGDEGAPRLRVEGHRVEDDGGPLRGRRDGPRGGRRQGPHVRDPEHGRDRDRRGREDGGGEPELHRGGEGGPGGGQAADPHPPQEVPEPPAPGYPPAGRPPDPRGHAGEPEPPPVQDREAPQGRERVRGAKPLAGPAFSVPWSSVSRPGSSGRGSWTSSSRTSNDGPGRGPGPRSRSTIQGCGSRGTSASSSRGA